MHIINYLNKHKMINKKMCSFFIFGLCFLFTLSIQSALHLMKSSLKKPIERTLINLYKKSEEGYDITEEILGLDLTLNDLANNLGENWKYKWVTLQKGINFTTAYDAMEKYSPDNILEKIYQKTLRFNRDFNDTQKMKVVRKLIIFLFNENKKLYGKDYAEAIEIAMLAGDFTGQILIFQQIYFHRMFTSLYIHNIFQFVTSAYRLFGTLNPDEQNKFKTVFRTFEKGEQLITNGQDNLSDLEKTYRTRVINYLEDLKKTNVDPDLILLTGYYFLKLYPSTYYLPHRNIISDLKGFEGKGKFIEKESKIYELKSDTTKIIENESQILRRKFGLLQNIALTKVEQKIEKKEELTQLKKQYLEKELKEKELEKPFIAQKEKTKELEGLLAQATREEINREKIKEIEKTETKKELVKKPFYKSPYFRSFLPANLASIISYYVIKYKKLLESWFRK